MYPKWMKFLLLYFDLFGFSTQFNTSQNHSVLYRIIFFIHFILAVVSSLAILTFLRRPIFDKLGAINDSLKLCVTLLVYWLSLFELYFRQKTQKHFWIITQKIDKKFYTHHKLRFRAYALLMSFYSILYVLMYLNYVFRIFSNKRSEFNFFWACYSFVGLFHKNQLFYYLFLVEFIKNDLKIIDREITKLLFECKRGEGKNAKTFLKTFYCNRFKWIRQFFDSICDLKETLNLVFGWSNVAAIIASFLLTLTEINWLIWRVFNKFNSDVLGNDL